MQEPKQVVIVGAGYSGSLVAVNLLRQSQRAFKITLIEQRHPFGRGLAYRCWDDNLLLNVPAGNMSALVDVPEHFVKFCQTIDPAFNAGSFISRRIYGDYLEQTLAEALVGSRSSLEKKVAEVLAVKPLSQGFAIELSKESWLVADQVVLALGHFPPRNFLAEGARLDSSYVNNPWDFAALDQLPSKQPILIIGTGHTAVDTLFRLTCHDNQREVILLSRKGLVPEGHRFTPKPPSLSKFPAYLEKLPKMLHTYMHALREEAKRRMALGDDWRDVMNELRPHTPAIWQSLPLAERKRFLRHVVAYWDVHRHRLAPSAHRRLHSLLQGGKTRLIKGRIQAMQREDGVWHVHYLTQAGSTEILSVSAIINCTGPNNTLTSLQQPLVKQLLATGLLVPDPLNIGLQTDTDYRLLNTHGTASEGLYYIGPMLKAKFWEAVAVPELRTHAAKLASLLAQEAG